MAKRKTIKDYHDLAILNGGEFIGEDLPKNSKRKTSWRCGKCGCEWMANYNNISQGHWCPDCATKTRGEKSTIDKHVLIDRLRAGEELANAQCLSPHHRKAATLKKWKCNVCKNEWEATIYDIERGKGCRVCAMQKVADSNRYGPERYFQIGTERGFEWLGPQVNSTNTKTKWRCENGHVFSSPYSAMRAGDGCPFCAGLAPKTIGDYHQLAESRGFFFIGELPKNTKIKGLWRCEKGHEWEATYHKIGGRGDGCPECADFVNGNLVSQPQRNLFAMLEHLPKAELNTPYGRLNLDITFELEGELNICVEYDCWYWHKDTLKRDARRDHGLIRDGWRVLRVKSGTKLPTQAQLDAALAELVSGAKYTEIVLDDWGGS